MNDTSDAERPSRQEGSATRRRLPNNGRRNHKQRLVDSMLSPEDQATYVPLVDIAVRAYRQYRAEQAQQPDKPTDDN